MKNKHWLILAVLITTAVFGACKGGSSSPSEAGEGAFDKDTSYALGMNIGLSLRDSFLEDSIVPNYDELLKGMKDVMTGAETRFDEYEAIDKIRAVFNARQEKQIAESVQKEVAFLAENSKKPGVIITPSGLQYEIITETNGRKPSATDTVRVHYEGKLTDGSVFDSSYTRGVPAEFPLNQVIAGWSEGLQLMGVGSKYRLYIPSEYGYGSQGIQSLIPPYSTLIFEVELLEILN